MPVIDIILIALVGMVAGLVSIPFGFKLNDSPWIVYFGNALGSFVALLLLFYVSGKFIDRFLKKKIDKDEIKKVSRFIDKHGIRLFGLVSPLFPGVTISVPVALILKLDMRLFKKWLYVGIFLVSFGYVFGYYYMFVR